MSATAQRLSATVNGNPSADNLDGEFPLPLELLIDDREVIRALVEYPEGEARNQYRPRSAEDRRPRPAARWRASEYRPHPPRKRPTSLAACKERSISTSKPSRTNIEGKLKEYFDPKDGRFTDRVQRLVAHDGELSLLIKSFVDGENSLFARTLVSHVGRDSALMKVLDPQQSDGLLTRFAKASTTNSPGSATTCSTSSRSTTKKVRWPGS